MKWEIQSALSVHYRVTQTSDLLDPENTAVLEAAGEAQPGRCRLVVSEPIIMHHYGTRIRDYFRANRVEVKLLILPATESGKEMSAVLRVAAALNEIGALRVDCPPIAIGGGVLLDIVGLAAGLYRRGIPYLRIPTTLLAIVDVSVAAKTGVNFEGYRNRLGSYSPPLHSLIDKRFIETLPSRHIQSGLGEILKMALIKDPLLFELLDSCAEPLIKGRFQEGGVADEVIRRAIQGMVEELEPNLWERHHRRSVDYGHSFSPLIEMTYLPELLHGEAVALDCIFSAILAAGRGLVTEAELESIVRLAKRLGLPAAHPGFLDVNLLSRALEDTVRHRNGQQNLPLVNGIGAVVFVDDVTEAELARAARAMRRLDAECKERCLEPVR